MRAAVVAARSLSGCHRKAAVAMIHLRNNQSPLQRDFSRVRSTDTPISRIRKTSINKTAAVAPIASASIEPPTWSWVPPKQARSPTVPATAAASTERLEEDEDEGQRLSTKPPLSKQKTQALASVSQEEAAAGNEWDVIPVKPNTLLSSLEITTALTKMGGIDVKSVPISALDNIKEFIIVSGSSTRHLRKMSQAIVSALKARGITKAMGYSGAEGAKDDDWLLIDCYDRVVHLMLPTTRKSLQLEQHWAEDHARPQVTWTDRDSDYEANFEKVLEANPVPEAWDETAEELTTLTKESRKNYNDLGEL